MAKWCLLVIGVAVAEKCASNSERSETVPEKAVWESRHRDILDATLEEVSASYRGADLVDKLMNSSYDQYRIVVSSHRVYVHPALLNVDKSRKFVNMLAHMSEKLDDAIWLHDSGARGASMDNLPTTVIARKFSKRGILVPNPYFGKKRGLPKEWDKERSALRRASSSATRIPRVFWRGGVAHKYSCGRGEGNYARLQAISLTVCDPEHFDVRCQRGCGSTSNFSFDETCFERDEDIGLIALDDQYWPQDHYANYLFLLNLPGSTSGSYSRNLNHLWAAAGVVLMWQSEYVEWYYPALRHFQTHITVNKSTIKSAVELVLGDQGLSDGLREAARRVDAELVCGECIEGYVEKVVGMLHRHQLSVLHDGVREILERNNFTEIRAIEGTLKTRTIALPH